jgi:hypothetical protein
MLENFLPRANIANIANMVGTLIFSLPDVFTTTGTATTLAKVRFYSIAKCTRISLIFSFWL